MIFTQIASIYNVTNSLIWIVLNSSFEIWYHTSKYNHLCPHKCQIKRTGLWLGTLYFTKNCNSMKIWFVDLTEFFISFDTIASVIASKMYFFRSTVWRKKLTFLKKSCLNLKPFASIEIFLHFSFWKSVAFLKLGRNWKSSKSWHYLVLLQRRLHLTQCEKLRIVISLRFYMKSIWWFFCNFQGKNAKWLILGLYVSHSVHISRFSAIHILREINFAHYEAVILTIFEALNFEFLVIFHILSVQFSKKSNSKPPKL